jgi:DNA-binding transcriptional LysR family regulator
MELRHLRYFAAVADKGSFSGASRELHISQSAISEQIADLEGEVGVALFERSPQKTTLTAAGAAFLGESQRILAAAGQAVDIARRVDRGEVGVLRIGFFAGAMGAEFPRLIQKFRERSPGVQLSLLEMSPAEQWQALLKDRIDIGFTRRLEPEYRSELRAVVLRHDPIMAILPRNHPAAPGPVDVRDLANEPFVLSSREISPAVFDKVIELCSEAGFSPRIASISSQWTSVVLMVRAGVGVAMLPSNEQQRSTRDPAFCSLTAKNASVEFVLAWSRKRDGVITRNFREMALAQRRSGAVRN